MKILSVMWSAVLFNLQPEQEYKASSEIYEIIKEAQLYKYEYLNKEHPYSDIIWDVANDLKEINLEENQKLKNVFFKYWKEVKDSSKLRIFKNVNMPYGEKFSSAIKNYYIKNLIDYPTVMELFKFRTNISQKELKNSLNNFIKEIKFNDLKNQSKKDYWDNHITVKEQDKLLDLLAIAGMKGQDLLKYSEIGFLNKYRQAKYNKICGNEKEKSLITAKDNEVYLLNIQIDTTALMEYEENLGINFLNSSAEYISILFEVSLNLEKINKEKNLLKLIAYDKESYEQALIKRQAITNWCEKNPELLIVQMKKTAKTGFFSYQNKEIKEFGEKIILKEILENKLEEKVLKVKSKNKI